MHPDDIAKLINEDYEELEDRDVYEDDLESLADDPRTPAETLKWLADDEDIEIRFTVAKNPNTPFDILKAFSQDENPEIRCGVARNPKAPPEILDILSRDNDFEVRWSVAFNSNTPVEILKVLKNDKVNSVSSVATDNLHKRGITEDAASDARQDAVTFMNNIALVIVDELKDRDHQPDLIKSRQADTPAIIEIKTDYGSVFVQVFGKDNILLELSEKVSSILKIKDIYNFDDVSLLVNKLDKILNALGQWQDL